MQKILKIYHFFHIINYSNSRGNQTGHDRGRDEGTGEGVGGRGGESNRGRDEGTGEGANGARAGRETNERSEAERAEERAQR